MRLKHIAQIYETAQKPGEDEKHKFVVTPKDKDSSEFKKNCRAFSVGDIKAYYGTAFVSANPHQDDKVEEGLISETKSTLKPKGEKASDDENKIDTWSLKHDCGRGFGNF